MRILVRTSGEFARKGVVLALLVGSLAIAGAAGAAKPIGGGGGGGGKPPISVSPTSLSFGEQAVGSTSAVKTVTISNTGRTTLQITIALSGNSFALP